MKTIKDFANKTLEGYGKSIKETRLYKLVVTFPAKTYEVEFESDTNMRSKNIAKDAKAAFVAKYSEDLFFKGDRAVYLA